MALLPPAARKAHGEARHESALDRFILFSEKQEDQVASIDP